MDIERATLTQVKRGRNGQLQAIDGDVLGVVRQLKEIDIRLNVKYNKFGNYFVIYQKCNDGRERIVTTVQQLDGRIVEHMRKIGSEAWNRELGKQIDRMDDQLAKDKRDRFAEKVGEIGERLHHALGRDRGYKPKIIVPRGIR